MTGIWSKSITYFFIRNDSHWTKDDKKSYRSICFWLNFEVMNSNVNHKKRQFEKTIRTSTPKTRKNTKTHDNFVTWPLDFDVHILSWNFGDLFFVSRRLLFSLSVSTEVLLTLWKMGRNEREMDFFEWIYGFGTRTSSLCFNIQIEIGAKLLDIIQLASCNKYLLHVWEKISSFAYQV